jgi:hypothetical protein
VEAIAYGDVTTAAFLRLRPPHYPACGQDHTLKLAMIF